MYKNLRDRVVDGELVRLVYGMNQDPHVNDTRQTKQKIKVETLLGLEIGTYKRVLKEATMFIERV